MAAHSTPFKKGTISALSADGLTIATANLVDSAVTAPASRRRIRARVF